MVWGIIVEVWQQLISVGWNLFLFFSSSNGVRGVGYARFTKHGLELFISLFETDRRQGIFCLCKMKFYLLPSITKMFSLSRSPQTQAHSRARARAHTHLGAGSTFLFFWNGWFVPVTNNFTNFVLFQFPWLIFLTNQLRYGYLSLLADPGHHHGNTEIPACRRRWAEWGDSLRAGRRRQHGGHLRRQTRVRRQTRLRQQTRVRRQERVCRQEGIRQQEGFWGQTRLCRQEGIRVLHQRLAGSTFSRLPWTAVAWQQCSQTSAGEARTVAMTNCPLQYFWWCNYFWCCACQMRT